MGNSEPLLIRQWFFILIWYTTFISALLGMWFLLNIEKDHNKTEVGAAKTPLEITRLVHPVFSEERFRNEFFLCENRKKLEKKRCRNNRSVVLYTLHYTEKFTGKHQCLILINLQASRSYSVYYRTLWGGCFRRLNKG